MALSQRQRYDQLVWTFEQQRDELGLSPDLKLIFKETQRGQHWECFHAGEIQRRIYLPLWLLDFPYPWRLYYLLHEIAHELVPLPAATAHAQPFKDKEYELCKSYGIIIPNWTRTCHNGRIIEHNAYPQTILFEGHSYDWTDRKTWKGE